MRMTFQAGKEPQISEFDIFIEKAMDSPETEGWHLQEERNHRGGSSDRRPHQKTCHISESLHRTSIQR